MIIVYGCLELWTPQKFIFDNIPKYAKKKKTEIPILHVAKYST